MPPFCRAPLSLGLEVVGALLPPFQGEVLAEGVVEGPGGLPGGEEEGRHPVHEGGWRSYARWVG